MSRKIFWRKKIEGQFVTVETRYIGRPPDIDCRLLVTGSLLQKIMYNLTPPENQCHQSHRECLLQGRKYVHFDTIRRLKSPIIIQSLLHRRKYVHFDTIWRLTSPTIIQSLLQRRKYVHFDTTWTLSQITQCLLQGRTYVYFDTLWRLTSPIIHSVS
jgi:hypothetical protein